MRFTGPTRHVCATEIRGRGRQGLVLASLTGNEVQKRPSYCHGPQGSGPAPFQTGMQLFDQTARSCGSCCGGWCSVLFPPACTSCAPVDPSKRLTGMRFNLRSCRVSQALASMQLRPRHPDDKAATKCTLTPAIYGLGASLAIPFVFKIFNMSGCMSRQPYPACIAELLERLSSILLRTSHQTPPLIPSFRTVPTNAVSMDRQDRPGSASHRGTDGRTSFTSSHPGQKQ